MVCILPMATARLSCGASLSTAVNPQPPWSFMLDFETRFDVQVSQEATCE